MDNSTVVVSCSSRLETTAAQRACLICEPWTGARYCNLFHALLRHYHKEPEILFFDSPYLALKAISTELREHLGSALDDDQLEELGCNFCAYLYRAKSGEKTNDLTLIYWYLRSQLENELRVGLDHYSHDTVPHINPIQSERWIIDASWYDFYISEEKDTSQIHRTIFLLLFEHCGWIFPFRNICIVCDRPRILCFDSGDRLHAEGEPAIQFADGYSIYSYHGVTVPEKYGKLHPNQWRSQWLLEEDNAEFRRILIQGIGYSRICQELQAIELDLWQEYTLLKIDKNVDVEPIYLLKMTCPSTGFIHVLRVPPNIHSAREAIRWVNWETDPEEFSIQT